MSKGGGGAPAQQPQGSEGSLDFLWIIVLIIAAALIGWYFGKVYIVTAIFYVKSYEIIFLRFILGIWNRFAYGLSLPLANIANLDSLYQFVTARVGEVDFNTVATVNKVVGNYLRYLFVPILVGLTIYLYFGSITSKFRNSFNMKSFRDIERVNWPKIHPVVKLDLIKEDIDKGPWAMSMTPMQFCKKYNLLKEEMKDGKPGVKLLIGAAHRIFALQLGPQWTGNLGSLPEHMRALLAIFVARTDGAIEDADRLLDNIAASAIDGNPNFSGHENILVKHINAKPITKVLSRHAYITTMMASMLDLARGAGVLASAEFIWLKPYDRRLWYTLNNVGRQTAMIEAAGVFSHWLGENKLGRPLRVPMVDAAVNGLAEAVQETLYEPESK